jgi:hypothetical protein
VLTVCGQSVDHCVQVRRAKGAKGGRDINGVGVGAECAPFGPTITTTTTTTSTAPAHNGATTTTCYMARCFAFRSLTNRGALSLSLVCTQAVGLNTAASTPYW